jgi:UDP-sulfoquinovose synthase
MKSKTILVLGGDGYLGWPTAMNLATKGHRVIVVDNYSKRLISKQVNSEPLVDNPSLVKRVKYFKQIWDKEIEIEIGDLTDYSFIERLFLIYQPDTIIHYARNNLIGTHNLLWGMVTWGRDTHLIKLGTAGEYGTPNIDIEEGWLDIEHNGRKDKFLFPRAAGSLYHTTKVLDTDLIWFFVRMFDLKVTDLMQGPVYGIYTDEIRSQHNLMPTFYYDDIFGTVINRFVTQAVAGIPLTVYGKGGQTRGYLNIKDTLQCIDLAVNNPAKKGDLDIYNQITEQFSVVEIANRVKEASKELGITVDIGYVPNPRRESEDHYYNMKHSKFSELGLVPNLLNKNVLVNMINYVKIYKHNINRNIIKPRVTWHK